MKLIISPRAENDLEQIADYISLDNPDRAFSYIDEIEAHCAKLLLAPNGGAQRNDLSQGLRSSSFGNYIILYRVEVATLRVERVLHSARHFPALFNDV